MYTYGLNPYKKKRKSSLSKIAHVYDTEKNESIWIVKTVDGKRQKISKRKIKKNKLLTSETTWSFDRLGLKFRYEIGKEKRYVFWTGFRDPSIEPGDFKPQVLESSEEEIEE